MASRFMMLLSVFCCSDTFADPQLDLANRPPLFPPSLVCLCSAGAFYSLPGMSPRQDRSLHPSLGVGGVSVVGVCLKRPGHRRTRLPANLKETSYLITFPSRVSSGWSAPVS